MRNLKKQDAIYEEKKSPYYNNPDGSLLKL